MRTEIIIATYNKPAYLSLCLNTILGQTTLPDTICIADDGSGPETTGIIEEARRISGETDIRHIWIEDAGFRKCSVLNKAIASSNADYIVFTDDDCLWHPSSLARHLMLADRKLFLTGSLIRMSQSFSDALLANGRLSWDTDGKLAGWQPTSWSEFLKSVPNAPKLNRLLEVISPVRRSLVGSCSSTFRKNLIAVNGFNETMGYGGSDKELGVRLVNSGIYGRHVRYSAPVYHLFHERSYFDSEVKAANRKKILKSRREGTTWTGEGIEKSGQVQFPIQRIIS